MSVPFEAGVDLERYLLTPERIGDSLGISEKEARSLIQREIPHAQIGPTTRLLRVRRSDFREWRVRSMREKTDSAADRECSPESPTAARTMGLVYFIEAIGAKRIKIGWTGAADASERLRTLQTSSPFELGLLLQIPGTMLDEQSLHRRFHKHRVMPTTEWFHASEELFAHMLTLGPQEPCDGQYQAPPCAPVPPIRVIA